MVRITDPCDREVFEKYGVHVPKWGETNGRGWRSYTKAEYDQMHALVDWLVGDDEYNGLINVYREYCNLLVLRNYGNGKDKKSITQNEKAFGKIARNFAECQVRYIYHDMCCDGATILGRGNSDGYWIYLEKRWLDIANMKVGSAILNLDEVWSVVDGVMREWQDKCSEREQHFVKHRCYRCDRCGKDIFDHAGSRFDPYENLLHCPACVKECCHWGKQ